MIKGIGVDLVAITRFESRLYEAFLNRVLSPEERRVYESFNTKRRQMVYLAGRFAVKEAYTKAVKRFETPLNFNEVSVLNDAQGAPYLITPYEPQDTIHVSLSHDETHVVAMVVIERA